MRAIVLATVLVLGVATARAEGVGVVVTGDATIQPQLAAQIEDWLRQRGHELVAAPLRPDALGVLIDCFVIEDLACARKLVEGEGNSPRLMFARADLVVTTSGARDITITGYWFSRGADPMAARRTCTACTDSTMHSTIDDVMTTLAGKARVDVGILELSLTPATATVRIDGKDGAAGAALPVGDHVIEISASGYTTERRTVTVKGGEKISLSVQLTATVARSKLPLIVVGAGVALLATGVVLYATSEEDTGEKPEYRDTRAGGIALSVVGGVAITVGAWLYMRSGSRTDSAPTVAVGSGSAYIGWVRAF